MAVAARKDNTILTTTWMYQHVVEGEIFLEGDNGGTKKRKKKKKKLPEK
jgi:hypothetical protein